MPPATARTATIEPATTTCRLVFARLASRSRSTRSRSRAAVLAAWLFRLLMVVFSSGGRAHAGARTTKEGDCGCSAEASDEDGRARRSTPSQGVREDPAARAVPAGSRGHGQPAPGQGLLHRDR